MVLLLTSSNQYLKVASYLLLIFTISVDGSYYIINGYGFYYTEASVALSEKGFAADAILTFFPKIWFVLPLAILFATTLFVVTEKYLPKTSWKISIPFTLFFVLLSFYVLRATTGQQTYPTMFKVPVLGIYAATYPIYTGPRDPVPINPVRQSPYRHIIYLVDESVRGDMISLNDPSNNVTPFLFSIRNNILNYGIMSSGSNQSGNSQLILRSGVRESFFPDTGQVSLRIPDILQYAKKAGYKVNFLDGQKDVLQNFMKEPEMSYIDIYKGVKEKSLEGSIIDRLIADDIVRYLGDSLEMTFTYVVKMGAHFRYANYYPPDQNVFTPAMERGELNNDREKMVNSFKNVIRWNVDLFFKYLIEKLGDRKDYIIIYTSDHGQTLLEHGIVSTHADVKNAHPFQACVPFFIYLPDPVQKKEFLYNSYNYDHLSHFNIFPSILLMMGYDTAYVRQNYDPAIFDSVPHQSRYFYTGMLFMKGGGYKTLFDTPEMTELIDRLQVTGYGLQVKN